MQLTLPAQIHPFHPDDMNLKQQEDDDNEDETNSSILDTTSLRSRVIADSLPIPVALVEPSSSVSDLPSSVLNTIAEYVYPQDCSEENDTEISPHQQLSPESSLPPLYV